MPPRFLGLFIVAFWLMTTSWLFHRDLRPRLWPGAPPPYTIDLTDEAQSNISSQWTILQNGHNKGYCKTTVRYWEHDDTFELGGQFKLWSGDRSTNADLVITSSYRITRDGELRGVEAQLKGVVVPPGLKVDGKIEGKIQGGLFSPIVSVIEPLDYSLALKPVRVTSGGSVLNPLQPIHRLAGLRRGQQWEISLIDPLSDLAHQYIKELTGASPATQLRVLHARVLPQIHLLPWGGRTETVPCFVIQYEGEDTSARTWVRESDGLVLQQELTQGNQHYVLVRDS